MNKNGSIDADGFRLHYKVEGNGMAVLIPGSTVYYPRVFSEELKRKFQFIHMDHRGFVPPPGGADEKDYTLGKLIEDIEKLRIHLGLTRFLIMGHSGHAFMALEYAKKYPEHISGVVLIAVTPDYSEATHCEAEQFFEQDAEVERKAILRREMEHLPQHIAADPEKRFVAWCLAAGAKSWYDMHFNAAPLWEGIFTNMPMIDYVWGQVFRDIDITRNLRSFNRPVLIAVGKFDYLTGPARLWNRVLPYFRNASVHVFEKSAHCPQYEEHEVFDCVLTDWVSRNLMIAYR